VIINVRRQLPWRQRLISDVSTAGLWVGFLWLCRPVIGIFAPTRFVDAHLVSAGAPFAAERMVLTLLVVTAGLLLWRKLADRRKAPAAAEGAPNYAGHFGLNDLQLHRGRSSQVCVVHHDADGRIVGIDAVAADALPVEAAVTVQANEAIAQAA
jgi:poly-beta-1,6-N-acetyl-D-glucosamine biosynthesis protein PgaD